MKPTDLVIHVGDFCDGGVSDLMAYRKRLNGSVLLVKGNHDVLPDEVYKAVFQSVCEVLVIEELNVMLQHCPSTEAPSSFRRVVGHFHDGCMPDFLNDGRSFCSCVMRRNHNLRDCGRPESVSRGSRGRERVAVHVLRIVSPR